MEIILKIRINQPAALPNIASPIASPVNAAATKYSSPRPPTCFKIPQVNPAPAFHQRANNGAVDTSTAKNNHFVTATAATCFCDGLFTPETFFQRPPLAPNYVSDLSSRDQKNGRTSHCHSYFRTILRPPSLRHSS